MLTQKTSAAGSTRRPARIFGMAFTLFLAFSLFDAPRAQELRAMKPGDARAVSNIDDKKIGDKKIGDKNIGDEKTASTKAEGKDYGDMVKLVEALEERVRQLEARLAKMEATQT